MPSKVKIKDHGKCKEWERRRRDRLNDAFKNLAQLLPHHDPAKIPAKIDILEKSTEFVKELRLSNSRLLSNQAETDEKCKLIKELQDEVNRLILRVKQLTLLLNKANITIPTGPEIKSLGPKRQKWSGILKPKDVENNSVINGSTTQALSPSENLPPETVNSGRVEDDANTTSSTISTATSQTVSAAKTSSSVTSAGAASIIVPLKETNSSKKDSNSKKSPTKAKQLPTKTTINKQPATSVVTTSTTTQSLPTIVTSLIAPSPVSISSSPTKLIATCDPIFTTATATPLQLPLQTFIIASCPITATPGSTQAPSFTSPGSQTITRIANILPQPLLTQGLEGFALQKIPIKSILKPKPKVIWRRKKKRKNAPSVEELPTKQAKESTSAAPTNPEPITEHVSENEIQATETEKQAKETTVEKDKEMSLEKNKTEAKSTEQNKESGEVFTTSNDSVQIESKSVSEPSPSVVPPEKDPSNGANENSVGHSKAVEVIDIAMEEPNVQVTATEIAHVAVEIESVDESVPVLRIIEASSEGKEPSTDILSTVVVQSTGDKESTSKNAEPLMVTESKDAGNLQEINTQQHIGKEVVSSPLCETEKSILLDTMTVPEKSVEDKISEPIVASNSKERVVLEKATTAHSEENMHNVDRQLDASGSSALPPTLENATSSGIEEISTNINENSTRATSKEVPDLVETITDASTSLDTHRLLEIQETSHTDVGTKSLQTDPQPLVPIKHILSDIASSSSGSTTELSVLTTLGKQTEDNTATIRGVEKMRKSIMETSGDTVSTTDKISECIARSIDLIDANDSELMELGEHWEDNGTSPKSISPTQIFLNMFPLLPRESSAPEAHHQAATLHHQPLNQQPSSSSAQTPKNALSFLPSSNSRSSFFIDAMLPDDHSVSSTVVPSESNDANTSAALSHSPFLPLTPPQYSSSNQQMASPFSLSSSYYWTPSTVPSSTITEVPSSEFRSSYNSNLQLTEGHGQRAAASSSAAIVSTAATLTNTLTKASATANTDNIFTSILQLPNSSTQSSSLSKTSSSESHRAKRSKTTASSGATTKVAPTSEINVSTVSKSKAASSTVAKTTTPSTSVTVTWCLSAPTQSTSFQQMSSNTGASSMETNSEASVFSAISSSGTQSSHHPCSILDSLNPIDAAFFRPLINALDSHDFRALEFPGTTALPPPPPPLPLIPPPPTKPLYSSQFTPSSQAIQSSVSSTNYHDHTIQGSFLNHHQQPIQLFGSNIQQLTSENLNPIQAPSSSSGTNKTTQTNTHTPQQPSLQAVPKASLVPRLGDSSKEGPASSDKTSRTSGRQKNESTKKSSRFGKSSRTQPYATVPSSSSAPTPTIAESSSKPKQALEQGTTLQSVPPTSTNKTTHGYSIHTIQSHISPASAKISKAHSSRNFDFQSESTPISSHFETPQMSNIKKVNETRSGSQVRSTERVQQPRKSESKSQKSKQEKVHAQGPSSSNSVKEPKPSRTNYNMPSSTTVASQVQQGHSNPANASVSSSQPSTGKVTTLNQPHGTRTNAQQESTKLSQNVSSSNLGFPQAFNLHQSSVESFQLFPEFSVTNNSRQSTNSQTPATHHYNSDNGSQAFLEHQQQHDQQASINNFHTPRSHPYYFSDITGSLESFVPMQVSQPQPNFSVQQTHASATNDKQTVNPSGIQGPAPGGETNNPKLPSAPQGSNICQPTQATPMQNFQASTQQHVIQQQRNSRQHQNTFVQHEAPHSCTQTVLASHPASIISNPQHTYTQQQRLHAHQPSCPQHISQNRNSNNNVTQPAAAAGTSSIPPGKGKHHQSTVHTNSMSHASSSQHHQQNSNMHNQHTVHQQTSHHHHQQQQQNVSNPQYHASNRPSSSKTVNWMTDTGYRSTSSNPVASNKPQQRQSSSTSTSNPFPVSKLVGSSSSSKSQQQVGNNSASDTTGSMRMQQQQQQQQPTQNTTQTAVVPSSNVRSSKQPRNTGGSSTSGHTNTSNQSQGQSIYCAEALIRKIPPASAEWTPDFNLLPPASHQGPQPAPSYSHHHHSNQNLHVQQHTSGASDEFPTWNATNMSCATDAYNYGSGPLHNSSSNQSHFPHFDHSQSQYQSSQHHHQHHQTHGQNVPSNSYNVAVQGQRHHGSQAHSQSLNTGSSQVNYSHHQQHHSSHHHHHQHHQSSTSSVTNFNLSTIFPEINDKRNSNGGGTGRAAGNAPGNINAGNMNAQCGYHHVNFGNQPGSSGNLN